jgi:hypothetical protein
MLGSGLNSEFAPLDIGSALGVSSGSVVHEWRDGWNHMCKQDMSLEKPRLSGKRDTSPHVTLII